MGTLAVAKHGGERPPEDLVVGGLERQPQVVHPLAELVHGWRFLIGGKRVCGKPVVAFQRGAYRLHFGGVQALVCVAGQLPAYRPGRLRSLH
jgi:hypothetical protein